MNITLIVSGTGENIVLKALHQLSGWMNLNLSVIGYDINSSGLTYAKESNISYLIFEKGESRESLTSNIIKCLNKLKPDCVILLFHRLLGEEYFREITCPTINIHPSLLPSFSGFKAVDQAIMKGVQVTGVTVHFVDESEDGGPIIIQGILPLPFDSDYFSISDQLNYRYCGCVIQTIEWIKNNKINIKDERVSIAGAKYLPNKTFYPNLEIEVVSILQSLSNQFSFSI